MTTLINTIERLEEKQHQGLITFEEAALLGRLIELVEKELYN